MRTADLIVFEAIIQVVIVSIRIRYQRAVPKFEQVGEAKADILHNYFKS